MSTHFEWLQFHLIKMLCFFHSTDQWTGGSFGVGICVKTFNNVACGVANLPYKLRYEAFFPTNSLERKLAADFILHPICKERDYRLVIDWLRMTIDLPVPTFPPSRVISWRHPSKSSCSMHMRLRIFFLTGSGTAARLIFLWTCTWHSRKIRCRCSYSLKLVSVRWGSCRSFRGGSFAARALRWSPRPSIH